MFFEQHALCPAVMGKLPEEKRLWPKPKTFRGVAKGSSGDM